jgi:hypothetical protein
MIKLKMPSRQTEFPLSIPTRPSLKNGVSDYCAKMISISSMIIGLRTDGTIITYNHQSGYNFDSWYDIVDIARTKNAVIGLKADGTCLVTGPNASLISQATKWTDIVQVVGDYTNQGKQWSTVSGLKEDGTVISCGSKATDYITSSWTDIVSISAGIQHLVGLKSNGTCVGTGCSGHSELGITGWTNIVQLVANQSSTIGLKSNGTCVGAGRNTDHDLDITGWTNIVQLVGSSTLGYAVTVGLKSNGTCVEAGTSSPERNTPKTWSNIAYLSDNYITAIKDNGTCVATGADLSNFILDVSFDNFLYKTHNTVYGYLNNVFSKLTDAYDTLSDAEKIKLFNDTNGQIATLEDLQTLKAEEITILNYSSNDYEKTIKIQAIPNNQIITYKELISLHRYENINQIDIAVNEENEGIVKILCTTDGINYKRYSNNEWIDVPLDNIETEFMTAAEIRNFDYTIWKKLNPEKIGFAYLLSINTEDDIAEVDNLSINVDMKGSWNSVSINEDCQYKYFLGGNLKIYLLKDGDYKINYNLVT